MIYTLTLNPAIDLFIDTDTLREGEVNRTNRYDVQANGKGVNVSFILKRLGIENTALGIGGGFTLNYISSELQRAGIPNDMIDAGGITRINVFTHVNEGDREFKLVNPGPEVTPAALEQLHAKLAQLHEGDTLVISGSFSKGIAPTILKELAMLSEEKHFDLVIDTSYPEVLETLAYHPRLIKPNDHELASWFGDTGPISRQTTITHGRELIRRGAQSVLISCGEDGAIYLTADQTLTGNAPHIEVLNTAGAGDTMLGTFLAGLVTQQAPEDNLKHAIAAGSDTARSSWITDFQHLDELLTQIKISEGEQTWQSTI